MDFTEAQFQRYARHLILDEVGEEGQAKLMAALELTTRGTPQMYYGEELGMRTTDPARIEDVHDPIGKLGWPKEKGRDGERTPMQWDGTANAGFTTSAKPWLQVPPTAKTYNVETESKITAARARELFAAFPGLRVVDEPAAQQYPTPLTVEGQDDCVIGRVREDLSHPRGLSLWVVGDQLRKGAATNAVQIAELVLRG